MVTVLPSFCLAEAMVSTGDRLPKKLMMTAIAAATNTTRTICDFFMTGGMFPGAKLGETFKYHDPIVPAESKGIAHRHLDLSIRRLRLSQDYLQALRDLRIEVYRIDGREQDGIPDAQYTGDGLDGSRRAQEMACHG